MYIIVHGELNIILYIGEFIQENEDVYIIDNTRFDKTEVKLFRLESIPTFVLIQKYCYSSELGFYKNANYLEADKTIMDLRNYTIEKFDNLQDDVDYLILQNSGVI